MAVGNDVGLVDVPAVVLELVVEVGLIVEVALGQYREVVVYLDDQAERSFAALEKLSGSLDCPFPNAVALTVNHDNPMARD